MFEVGQKVKWTIGKMNMSGAVLQDTGKAVKVMTHFRDSCPFFLEVEVEKKLLKKITGENEHPYRQ